MEEQFTVNRGFSDCGYSAEITDFLSNYFHQTPVPPDPLAEATLSPLSATSIVDAPRGPDRIGSAVLQNLPDAEVYYVLDLFTSRLRLHHFPRLWKYIISIVMILNPKATYVT